MAINRNRPRVARGQVREFEFDAEDARAPRIESGGTDTALDRNDLRLCGAGTQVAGREADQDQCLWGIIAALHRVTREYRPP